MGRSAPSGFKFDLLKAAPAAIDLRCQEAEEDEVKYEQYEIEDTSWIWYRVVCVNRVLGKSFKNSLLGPTGHLERASVWVHLAAASCYLVHAVVRSMVYSGELKSSLSNNLVTVDSVALVLTFAISSTYHVYSPHPFWSAVARQFDYIGIYLSVGTSYTAGASLR